MVKTSELKVGDKVLLSHGFLDSISFVGEIKNLHSIGNEEYAITIETLTDAIVTVTTENYLISRYASFEKRILE